MKNWIRKAMILLATVLCMTVLSVNVWAEDTAPVSGSSVYVQAITVTNAAGGEVTTVERGDRINVVMRVVDHSAAKNFVKTENIVARINSSVFQYTGAAEVSQLYENQDEEGKYYSYVLLFRDVLYQGGGNTLDVTLSYNNTSMEMQNIPNLVIGQCVDKDPKTPSLMVRESSYGNENVVAGEAFTLSVTVYATAGEESLSDVMATVTLPNGLTLTGGSLSNYIGGIAPQGTRTVQFQILPAAGFAEGVANVSVALSGTGKETGTAASGSCVISVPISQPDRFELGNLEATEMMMVGEEGSVTLNFVNKGRNVVSNLEASLSGSNLGFEGNQVQYVGNVNAGTDGSVDFEFTPDMPGNFSGVITLTYELQDGSQKTLSKDFSGTVEEMPVYDDMGWEDMPMEPMPEEKTGVPMWVWILVGSAVVIVGAVVGVKVSKKRKAAKLDALEDEGSDENF